MTVRLRLQLPVRVTRFMGSLRCVLRGHAYGGLLMEHGRLYHRCAECGDVQDLMRVYTRLRGGR